MTHSQEPDPIDAELARISRAMIELLGTSSLSATTEGLDIPEKMQWRHMSERVATGLPQAIQDNYHLGEATSQQLVEYGVPTIQPRKHTTVSGDAVTTFGISLSVPTGEQPASPDIPAPETSIKLGDVLAGTCHPVQAFTSEQVLTVYKQALQVAQYHETGILPLGDY